MLNKNALIKLKCEYIKLKQSITTNLSISLRYIYMSKNLKNENRIF